MFSLTLKNLFRSWIFTTLLEAYIHYYLWSRELEIILKSGLDGDIDPKESYILTVKCGKWNNAIWTLNLRCNYIKVKYCFSSISHSIIIYLVLGMCQTVNKAVKKPDKVYVCGCSRPGCYLYKEFGKVLVKNSSTRSIVFVTKSTWT